MLKHRWYSALVLGCMLATGLPTTTGLPATEAADLPTKASLKPLGLELKWFGQAVLNTSRDAVRYVTGDEDVIVVQSSAGVVSVFNAEDGRRRWAAQVGRNDEFALPATTTRRHVIVLAGPVVHALDKFTGDEVLQHRLPRQPSARPGTGNLNSDGEPDEYLYIPMVDGSVYAYRLQTLLHLERYGVLPRTISRPFAWRFICNETIVFPPMFVENALAFVTNVNNFYILNPKGQAQYQYHLDAPITTPLMVTRDQELSHALFATGDNQVHSFALARPEGVKTTATVEWTYPFDRDVAQRPLAVDDDVFVVTGNGGLYNISLETGRPVQIPGPDGRQTDWYVPQITSVLAVSDHSVYGVDLTDRLIAMDRSTALFRTGSGAGATAPKNWLPVDTYQHRYQNSLTNWMYLVSSSGEVLCLRETDSAFARYQQNPTRQPIDVDVPDQDPQPVADQNTGS